MGKRNSVIAILIAMFTLLVFTGCTDPVFVESIKLDVSELSMVKGDEYTVKAEVYPGYVLDKELTWTVDRDDVATVDGGHITAVGNGTAVVTATAAGGAKASVKVTVHDTVVKLDAADMNLIVGDSIKVNASVKPDFVQDKDITWSVKGDAVTAVDGLVVAVKPGNAVVTAKHSSGAYASFNVVVEAPSISFTEDVVHLHKGDTHTLELVITPDYAASRPVAWSVDTEGIVSINDGVITGNDNGDAVVTATVEGVGSASVKVSVHTAVVKLDVESEISMVVGDAKQVNATVDPETVKDKEITWAVAGVDGDVVSVDKGLITAVKPGKAVVIANHSSGAFETVSITVSDITVSLDAKDIMMVKGDELKVNATVGPEILVDKTVSWSVDGDGVVTVENGLIKAVGVGNAVVTATHARGKSASVNVSVKDADLVAGRKPIADIIEDKNLGTKTSLKIVGKLSDEDFKALNGMSSLTSLDLSEADNKSLSEGAFMYNSNLTSIKLPKDLTAIEGAAFAGMSKIKTIEIPGSVTVIGASAFSSSSIERIVVPEGVQEIGASAFDNCKSLTSVELPSTLSVIGDRAFAMSGLSGALSLPSGITSIGENAFSGTTLTSVELPASLEIMYDNSFSSNLNTYRFLGNTPPGVVGGYKATINRNAAVFVPEVAVDTYKKSEAMQSIFDVSHIKPIAFD